MKIELEIQEKHVYLIHAMIVLGESILAKRNVLELEEDIDYIIAFAMNVNVLEFEADIKPISDVVAKAIEEKRKV